MRHPEHPPVSSFPRPARRGSVIIFVLGVILLTAFLLTRLMDRASVELAAESKANGRAAMRQEAFSGLEASLAVLADYAAVDNGLHAVEQGWAHPLNEMHYLPAPGFTVDVTVEDETGKLSLPAADAATLRRYLAAIGCPTTSLDRLVDALLEWTKSDHIADTADSDTTNMENAALPYQPPQRPLRSFEELRAIPTFREIFIDEKGGWNDLARRFFAGASVFQFSSSNTNSISPDVLAAFGVEPNQAETVMHARLAPKSGTVFFGTMADLSAAWGQGTPPPGLGIDAICLHLKIAVKQGGRDYRLDAWASTGSASPAAAAPVQPAAENGTPGAQPDTTPSVRTSQRKKVDSPFNILELRENDGA